MDSRKPPEWYSVDTVRHLVTFTAMGCECQARTNMPIRVTLSWSAESPHEIRLVFLATRQGDQEWCTALSLLIDGLYGPAGHGDLSIFPCLDDDDDVELILESPSHPHPVGFTVRRRDLEGFVVAVQEALEDHFSVGKGA